MNRKIVLMAVLVFMFLAIFAIQAAPSVRAESTGTSEFEVLSFPKWFVDANGTVFQITNSSYLNVTLTSSEPVHVFLESVPRMVSYGIERLSSANSTVLTLSGFVPSTTYYRHQDGYLIEEFTTDSSGGYTYTQDISEPHHVYILEYASTLYISSNYTFTHDIYEPIVVAANNIVIDGNLHILQGPGSGYGFYLDGRSGVTIKNVRVERWTTGIRVSSSGGNTFSYNYIYNNYWAGFELMSSGGNTIYHNEIKNNGRAAFNMGSNDNTISGNTITANRAEGIVFDFSNGNIISGNTITSNRGGILLHGGSRGNTISGNILTTTGWGISIMHSHSNTVSDNTITYNNGVGIQIHSWSNDNTIFRNTIINNAVGIKLRDVSTGHTIYHNNLIGNAAQASDESPAANYWHNPTLLEGNYWSDYPGADNGSGTGKHAIAGDGIGDTNIPWPGPDYDYYPFTHQSGWLHHLTVQTEPLGITTILGEGWYDTSTDVSLEAPANVPVSAGAQYRFDYWTVDDSVVSGNPITVHMDADHTATARYVKQYYLTVVSAYDTPGGEGWYDEGETAYATLAIGLDYSDTLVYGFVGWSGDASGWDLISEPIRMNAPKTAIANWESSSAYGDVRNIIFWKYQANVWYFTERARTDLKIRGIGTPQISEEVFIAYLTFIDTNSDYFRGKIVQDNNGDGTITNLEILQNAYNFLKTPTGLATTKMRAEQQLLALWLNLAYKAFFWNTQLGQDTLYIYWQYTYDDVNGLATIGEAIQFCEAELLKTDGNYEAAKNICDSINNNLGIIWGT